MSCSNVWFKTKRLLQLLVVATAVSPAAFAHEFWIEPKDYRIEAQSTIEATLRNGENFAGSTISYNKGSTNRFDLYTNAGSEKITARAGDNPALAMTAEQSGLHVIVHQSPIATLPYKTWEKFQKFADHKDFKNMLARHQARNLPEKDFREVYSRFSKSLIAVGDGRGSDEVTGLEIELVATQNPYTDELSNGLEVTGYYQGDVRPDAQIELFEKAPDGTVTISLLRTDDQGVVVLPVKSKYRYLVDMVVLREPSAKVAKDKRAVWETLWASLTFEVK